jgi:FdhD protein
VKRGPDIAGRVSEAMPRLAWRAGESVHGFRPLAGEIPAALVHDAVTTAVTTATPVDLEDLAVGFTLSEGLAETLDQIQAVEVKEADNGVELDVWLDAPRSAALTARRERQAGPTGAGLAGAEALAEALRRPPRVVGQLQLGVDDLRDGLRVFLAARALAAEIDGLPAAGFWTPSHGLVAAREDVHARNALDKLVGAVAKRGLRRPGLVAVAGPLTAELVRRAAGISAPILVATGAPTAPAVRAAEAADLTLAAMAGGEALEIYTRADRVLLG